MKKSILKLQIAKRIQNEKNGISLCNACIASNAKHNVKNRDLWKSKKVLHEFMISQLESFETESVSK